MKYQNHSTLLRCSWTFLHALSQQFRTKADVLFMIILKKRAIRFSSDNVAHHMKCT